MFELALAGLTLLALVFCWPLWSRKGSDAQLEQRRPRDSRDAYNMGLYQAFEVELLEDRTLDDAARSALLADKARQLLDDRQNAQVSASERGAESTQVATAGASSSPSTGPGLGLGAKLAAAILLVAGPLFTYWSLGTPGADQLKEARQILQLPSLGELKGDGSDPAMMQLRRLTAGLRAHVARDPEAAGSWYLLGIGELKLQSYSAASDAFEAASELVGADPNLDLYWLQARLLADNGKLSEATRVIAKRVLGTQPNQPMVLNMLALAAFRSEDFATAVSYLNSALSNNLTQEQRDLLAEGYDQARASLGVSGPTIDVALSLTGEPPADAVLFVIARPVGGGIPFAVVRRPAAGITDRIRLDDAVSMNPANPLSGAGTVEIVARLSLTGRPQAGPGDWQWQSRPLELTTNAQPIQLRAELKPAG